MKVVDMLNSYNMVLKLLLSLEPRYSLLNVDIILKKSTFPAKQMDITPKPSELES